MDLRCPAVGALLLAFVLSPKLGDLLRPFGLSSRLDLLTLGDLLLLFFAGVFLLRRAWRDIRPRPVDGPLILLMLCAFLSLAAGALQGTLPGLGMPLATVARQMEYLAGFLVVRALAPDWTARRAATLAFRTSAWLGAVALIDCGALAWTREDVRVFSTPFWRDQTNHLAGFMALGAVLGLALIPNDGKGRSRLAWAALQGLILGGLLATGSRGALLGALAGVTAFAARRRSWKPLAAGILLLAVASATGNRGGFLHEYKHFMKSEKLQSDGFPRLAETERNRLEVWTALREDVLRFPLFGTGPGSRNRVFYESQWVMTLAETGVLGLAALLLTLIALGRSALSDPSPLGAAMLGILACVAVQGLVVETLLVTRIAGPFWLLWGAFLQPPSPLPPEK